MITLNQTIEILKNFTFKHKALGRNLSQNNFEFGDPWEFDSTFTPEYPFLNTILLGTSYGKNGVITRRFQVDVSDKVNRDESNENHVLSDTQEICFDCIDYLQIVADSGDVPGLVIGEISELTDYTEGRDDSASGHYFTVEISTHRNGASCNLPIFDGNIFDGNYIYVSGSSTGGGCSPVLIKDQDGNTVETVQPGGTYIVTILTGIQQVIGNNNTTITQDIID